MKEVKRGLQLLEAHIRSFDPDAPTARERLEAALGEPLTRQLLGRGQGEGDPGSALGAVLGPDRAAVRFDEAACDGEPEPGAVAAASAVGAPEAVEHPRG